MLADTETEAIHPLLIDIFESFEALGIRWALLRGADDLARPDGDVDLLVDRKHHDDVRWILAEAGFIEVLAPGRSPHRFFFARDHGSWLKVDVVEAIAFGPWHEWVTDLANDVLARRSASLVRRLALDDEDWLWLLHQWLDKGAVAPDRCGEARERAQRVGHEGPVADWLRRLGALDLPESLLSQTCEGALIPVGVEDVRRALDTAGGRVRTIAQRAARHLPVRLARGCAVAVVGPDGSGKSTALAALVDDFVCVPRVVHMGVWRASRLDPFIEKVPGARLTLRAGRAASATVKVRLAGLGSQLVVMDRCWVDAALPSNRDDSLGGRILARWLKLLGTSPDTVLLLDGSSAVFHARKAEHSIEKLDIWRREYREALPQARIIDAAAPPATVHEQVRDETFKAVLARQRTPGVDSHGDWQFLLPTPCASPAGYLGAAATGVREILANIDPGAQHAGTGGPYRLIHATSPTDAELHTARSALSADGWLCLQTTRRPGRLSRSLASWTRSVEEAGFVVVARYWNAPRVEDSARIIDVADHRALAATFERRASTPVGRLAAFVAQQAVRCGVFDRLIRGATIIACQPEGPAGDVR